VLLSVATGACLLACATFSGTDQPGGANGGGVEAGAVEAGAVEAGGVEAGTVDAGLDAGVCPIETCAGGDPSCRYFDFAGPACPTELTTSGDTIGLSGLTFDCSAGALHVAASNTLDLIVSVRPKTPPTATSVHVQARMAITSWIPEGNAFRVQVGGVVSLHARMAPSGRPEVRPCVDGVCAADPPLATNVGEPHVYALDVAKSGIVISVDCVPRWNLAPMAVDFGSDVTISLGEADGNPFDVVLDDLEVAFR